MADRPVHQYQRGLIWFCLHLAAFGTVKDLHAEELARVDFRRDIRPILSDNCFRCHGPDSQRESDLRLDESLGIYDINTRIDLTAFDESSPQASQLDGADVSMTEGNAWNFNLSRLVSSG